jgi:hypothetical protein
MKIINFLKLIALLLICVVVQGCATSVPFNYAAFKESKPKSILVLPPINNSPDVTASYSVLSQVTHPLAESGYYVMPVSLVAEAFKENGLTQPTEMHATSMEKLREIFGADAALYITVTKFGPVYTVLNSETLVAVQARLVDLKNGKTLWTGAAQASSAEGEQQQQGGLAAVLIAAVVKQVLASTFDQSHKYAGVASERLLNAGTPGRRDGILFGPRSPNYGKDQQ